MGDMGVIFLFKNHHSLYQILENHSIKQKSSVKFNFATPLYMYIINSDKSSEDTGRTCIYVHGPFLACVPTGELLPSSV